MADPKKRKDEIYVDFVDVETLSDVARSTYTYDATNSPIFSIKEGKSHRMFSMCEAVGNTRIAYTFRSDKSGNFCAYTLGDSGGNEKTELLDKHPGWLNYRSYYIPIVEFAKNPFEERRVSKRDVISVMTEDYKSITRGVIGKNTSSGTIRNMYMFSKGKKTYLGSFDLIEGEFRRVFVYSTIDLEKDFKFLQCNAMTSEITPTSKYADDICVSIIHLTQPFDFFKPE